MFRKFIWILLEKGSITILNFGTLIILSRLLSPSDYGVYGIMVLFISITETLIDSGFGGAIVQKKDLQQVDINTLFFFNLAISIFAYIVLFVVAPFIENIYKIENLSLYFRTIGITLVLYALSLIQISLLNRKLLFRKSAVINVTSYSLASAIAITMAYFGWGIWSLIWQLILSSCFLAVFYWCTNRIRITFDVSVKSFTYMWKFGINTVWANITQTVVNNLMTSIIPKISTAAQAGYYFQANRVNSAPNAILIQCIDKGIFPILSKEANEANIIEKARSMNRFFLSIITPLFPLFSITAYPIVMILLGEKWENSVVYLSILAWSGIALCIQAVYRNIIKSTGKTKYIFYVEIIKSMITLTVLFISMKFGVLFMVYGFTISAFIGIFVWSYVLAYKFAYSFINQLRDLIKPLLASVLMILLIKVINIDCTSCYSLTVLPLGYFLYWIVSLFMKNKEIQIITEKFLDSIYRKKN